MATIESLTIADEAEAWRAAGFTVVDDACQVGSVRVRLVGRAAGRGILGWSLREVPEDLRDLDGVPTSSSTDPLPAPGPAHPIGATSIDHLVLTTPHLARTTAALEAIGLDVRRVRPFELAGKPMQQVFFRLGEVVLEVVGEPGATGEGPACFWGITFTVADLDAAAGLLGDACGRVKDAVQPGRRIATVRHRDLDLSVATALMSPTPWGGPSGLSPGGSSPAGPASAGAPPGRASRSPGRPR